MTRTPGAKRPETAAVAMLANEGLACRHAGQSHRAQCRKRAAFLHRRRRF